MRRVQSRALTCLHSILSTMDAESLGGAAALQGVAQHLSTLVFGTAGVAFLSSVLSLGMLTEENDQLKKYLCFTLQLFAEVSKDEEFLEAAISAMRSLLQMIASKDIPQVCNVQSHHIILNRYNFEMLVFFSSPGTHYVSDFQT